MHINVEEVQSKWKNPPQGVLKVNWDVALNSITKRLGASIIVQDHEGWAIAAKSTTFPMMLEPMSAEAFPALNAMEFSRDLGLQQIILEGDTLQVVNVANAREQN